MGKNTLEKLPIGISSFEAIRNANAIYVDKTVLIAELVQNEKVFFARPHGFGKSFLVSTLESLFKYGLRDFKGLAIERTWKDKTYNVLRLDFSLLKDFQDIEHFEKLFDEFLTSSILDAGFTWPQDSSRSVFSVFSTWLNTQPVNSLVILIDEYDAPLIRCQNDQAVLKRIQAKLSAFYLRIKSQCACLRFFFVTGTTKCLSNDIFGGINDFKDISFSPKFSALLGFTQEELQTYFLDYLQAASQVLSMPESELIEKMTQYYGGFCFDEDGRQKVFTPNSVLNFLANPADQFKVYCLFNDAGSRALLNCFSWHPMKSGEDYAKARWLPIDNISAHSDLSAIDEVEVLHQVGFYTIKDSDGGNVLLGYPNREVAESMAKLCQSLTNSLF